MTRYSVQLIDKIFAKYYWFLSFAKIMRKNIYKHLSSKHCQKKLSHAKQSTTDALNAASKREIQKAAETTDSLIGNKIDNKIAKVSRTSPQNDSGKLQMKQKIFELIEEYQKKDIYLQKKWQKLIDDLILM